ncbi:MAG: hypothetical protein LBE59_04790 [Nevskiaceae bacterium]|nr:hypothetical protein [Nevskiaceae bacterium]
MASAVGARIEIARDNLPEWSPDGHFPLRVLRKRAEQAVQGYVGHTDTLRRSIDLVCRLVEDVERK